MFNIVDYPPALGECSICKKHTCGTKEDGTQAWLHSPIELNVGGDLTIGYQCAKLIMSGFELTVEVVEKPILLTPTDEQIGDYVRNAVNSMLTNTCHDNESSLKTKYPQDMDRDELKKWLKDNNIEFTPQLGEDKLRELAERKYPYPNRAQHGDFTPRLPV